MIIDGLQCGTFTTETLRGLRQGQVAAVTVTAGFWEGPVETMDSIGRFHDLVGEVPDIACIVRDVAGIQAAARAGRTALVLGAQNTDLLGGRIRFVERFAEMGVRVMQLTYNNQNSVGGSCYEAEDSGLARFGHEVVREMNAAGVLIDLSHVGSRTTLDAIKASREPVAITHANAASLIPHARNKSDEIIHALRDTGGVIGCAAYRNITGDHYCASIDNWCDMVRRTVEIAGIDHVGIGTDLCHNPTPAYYDWMRRGMWTRGADYGAGSAANAGVPADPDWMRRVEQIGDIPAALARVGFSADEVSKITHGNWLRLYGAIFRA